MYASMKKLTIVTVNWYSTPLIDSVMRNLFQKAAAPEELDVLIIDNTNGDDKALQSISSSTWNVTIRPLDTKGLTGGSAHGAG